MAQFHAIEEAPALDKKYKHDIEVVVDRLVVREGIETRLADSFETALKLAEGLAYLDPRRSLRCGGSRTSVEARRPRPPRRAVKLDELSAPAPGRIVFSEKFACPVCGFTIAEIEPRLFCSTPRKAPARRATGSARSCCSTRTSSSPTMRSRINKGAVVPWAKSNPPSPYYMQVLGSLAREFDFDLNSPWKDLPEEARDVILHGTNGRAGHATFIDGSAATK